jgi:hypothetical protein
VPVSPADLPGSQGLGESLRVSPSPSESHLGLEHPGRDLLARARLGLRTGPVTIFSIISTVLVGEEWEDGQQQEPMKECDDWGLYCQAMDGDG